MKSTSAVLSILSFLVLGACSMSASVAGHDVAKADVGGGGNSFQYDFTCNGMKTGKQTFSHHDDYCGGLLDEGRNNSNCRIEREQQYNQDCR